MKKVFALLTFFFFYFQGSWAQEADLILEPQHKLKEYTFKTMITDKNAAGEYSIDIMDVQMPLLGRSSAKVDLYYKVIVQLYTEELDVQLPTLLEEVSVPFTLKVTGSNTSNATETFTGTLSINPSVSTTNAVFYFHKEELGAYALTDKIGRAHV